jgi:hypothetical protein
MKYLLVCLLAAWGAAAPAAVLAAYDEEGLSETIASSDTARPAEEEEGQVQVQESDEDLAAFVLDYIRRDIQLKGAFLLEDKAAGKILRLELVSAENAARTGAGGNKTVTAVFKQKPAGNYTVVFHLHPVAWGGIDIFKLELKSPPPGPKGKKKD